MRVSRLRVLATRRFFSAETEASAEGSAGESSEAPAEEAPAKKPLKAAHEGWQSKRDYCRAVVEAHLERTANPMVAASIREKMYELYKENPSVWTSDKVARVFGVPRGRVNAILTLCKMEESALPEGARDAELDGSVEEMLEAKFGVQLAAGRNKTLLRQERFQSPKYFLIDEDEGPLEEFGWKTQSKVDRVPAKEMEEEPLEEFASFKESRQIAAAPSDADKRKFRLVTVDTSKRYRDEERPIVVEEVDHSIRTADWTERRTLMTLYRARSRVLRNNLKGHLAMELMVDVDKFYTQEPKPIGIPDYWPNNQRRATPHLERIMERHAQAETWKDVSLEAAPEAAPEEGSQEKT